MKLEDPDNILRDRGDLEPLGREERPGNTGFSVSPAAGAVVLELAAGLETPSKRGVPGHHILDGIPVAGITGVNGAGKTLIAAQQAICDMAAGREVYSTVQVNSPWGNTKPIRSLRQLLTLRDCTLLLDEVSVIFSSRSSHTLPPDIVTLLQVLRHRNMTVIWTAPAWMRCDNLLREVTQAVLNVMPVRAFSRNNGSPWRVPRIVLAGLMDTSVGKSDAAPTTVLKRRILVPRRLDSWGSFDTLADTPLLGRSLQTGRCVDCGGTMEVPKHTHARHDALGLPWLDALPVDAPTDPATAR
jgi:hypothetical protein